jgi:hypothetical protein
MAKQIDLTVIDRLFAAQVSANESEATIKALRPQAEAAVQELMRQQSKPKNWTGTIEYHGFKIIVSRPKTFTWELNNQIQDANLDYYKQQHALYEQLNGDLKDLRADMKRTCEKLEKDHPDSESIKHGFRLAFLPA